MKKSQYEKVCAGKEGSLTLEHILCSLEYANEYNKK
jgi:hypothetical protein